MTGLHDFLAWIQASALGRFMRESGPWTYALVNLAHILGVSSLFGSILVLDLRLLGVWRRIPIPALASATVPVATLGFGLAAASGIALLATNATEYIGNPFLLIKFPAIALGVINVLVLTRSAAWQAGRNGESSPSEHRWFAVAGAVSLGCWLTAVAAGRLIAYW